MRLIDTSVVTAGVQYPGLANVGGQSVGNYPIHSPGNPSQMQGLDFLQQALLDMVDALCRALVIDTAVPTVISYIPVSSMLALASAPQYVYFQGEVFFVPSYELIAEIGGGGYIATIESNPTDNGSSAPLTTMSDGSQVSIHNQRTITISWSSTGSGGNFPLPSTWKYPQNNFQTFFPTLNIIGTGAGPQDYHTGWSQNTRLAYYILGNQCYLIGDAAYAPSPNSYIFILPDGYRPLHNTVVVASDPGQPSGLAPLYINSNGQVVYPAAGGGGIVNISATWTIL